MSNKKKTSTLSPIQWSADEGHLVYWLIELIQKDENYKVLFGKKNSKENSSGEKKIVVHGRIAQTMFPDEWAEHSTSLTSRVKSKIEDLCDFYKKHAARLRQTGEGVGGPRDENDESSQEVHQYLDNYIPKDGPHHDTPQAAKNIWAQIHEDFPYFGALHAFLCTRPSMVPPIVTTGTGPQGRRVVHNQIDPPARPQPFDDSLIDPTLLNRAATPPPPSASQDRSSDDAFSSPSRPISTNNRIRAQQTPQAHTPSSATPRPVRGPKGSTFGTDLTNAVEKARGNIKSIPKKRCLEDVIMEASRENLQLARERAEAQAQTRREALVHQKKELLFNMFKAGVYTVDELKKELAKLDAPVVRPASDAPTTPARVARTVTPRSSPRVQRFFSNAPGSPSHWEIEDSQRSLPEETTEL